MNPFIERAAVYHDHIDVAWRGSETVNIRNLVAMLILSISVTAGLAADRPLAWPQVRGPDGSGVADGQKPPVELGPDRNVKWKVPVPSGVSSPIVVGDNLVLTAFDGGKLYTIAYRRVDGKEVWRVLAPAKQFEKFHPVEESPAASTPASDGERIVAYFGSSGLFCYDRDGKELWKFEAPPALNGAFGSGVSPIIADGLVVLVRDELRNSRILALDLATGSLRWEKKRLGPISYCTPVVWDGPDGKQVVAAGAQRLIAYDLQTGAEKWFVNGMLSGPCASPVVTDDLLFYAGWSPGGADDKQNQMPSFDSWLQKGDTNKDGVLSRDEVARLGWQDFFDGFDTNGDGKITREEWEGVQKFISGGMNSAFAVRSGGTGDLTGSHLLWRKKRGLPYVPSGLVYRGQYILVKDGGLVSTYDLKTGKEIYVQERVAASGRYYASPVAANGNIYFTSLEHGAITVLQAGTDRPKVVARNPRLGERVAATPATADNTLYVRTEKHLYAFAEK
jgi:outer membrane protein assembly factor BamB